MNPFYEYLCDHLAGKLEARRVVVWYDTPGDFIDFIQALRGEARPNELGSVKLNGKTASLAVYEGSFFGLRTLIEPMASQDLPNPLLIYLPGVKRDREGSLLMEFEKGGDCLEPQPNWSLKRLARSLLRDQQFTDGRIDEMLAPESLSYRDVVNLLAQARENGTAASMLKVIFENVTENAALLARWLADEALDKPIKHKEAVAELYKLIGSRLGLILDPHLALAEARTKCIRYLLVNEFRSDLKCAAPSSLGMIPEPANKEQLGFIRKVAGSLRELFPAAYETVADTLEKELSLASYGLPPEHLGSTDTFRFEEKALPQHCDKLLTDKKYEEVLQIVQEREPCFWVRRDVNRQAQWEAARMMAELGLMLEAVRAALEKMDNDPAQWIKGYADSWHQADQIHRNLECWVAKMENELELEQSLGLLRREYEETLRFQAKGFSAALVQAKWSVKGILPQTDSYKTLINGGSRPVAYFLVDSLRYEMAMELASQLSDAKDLVVRPCVGVLPSITPIGMAALLPGASASFSIGESQGKLVACIEGTEMPGVAERMKYFKSRVPDLLDLQLGKLLQASSKKLAKDIEGKSVIVVRSQEIDALGESGDDWMARQIMDTIIGNLRLAIRKLATAGVERFGIAADHGHQFALRKEEDMRIESPGGDTLELHRRCWIGRGGQTPMGAIRVSGAELGYRTDLELAFPGGLGVFKCQGGLRYHHGAFSLQEIVVPLISFRMPVQKETKLAASKILLENTPEAVTNRTFGLTISAPTDLFEKETLALRVVLLSGQEQVGQAGMVMGGEFDRPSGILKLAPGKKVSVGMMLLKDDAKSLRIVVQDASTDAVLAESKEIQIKLSI